MSMLGFDNWDDAIEHMREVERQLEGTLTPSQRALRLDRGHDRYWMRFTDYGFEIFGIAWSDATLRADIEKACATYGGDVDEEMEMFEGNRERGYLTGYAWSEVLPEGEGGDTHVSQVVPISKEMFERARAAGWKRA